MRKGLIAAAALVALLIAAVGGAVNAKSASAKVPVPQGISSVMLQHSSNQHGGNNSPPVFPIDDNTPPNTPEDVTFVLDIQNRNLLENLVSNNMNGHFLSVDQFARSFGQSRQNLDALQSYLKHYGIKTTVMADDLDVQANGTAQQFDNALGVKQRDYQTRAIPAHDGRPAVPARHFHGAPSNPLLPRQLASFVDDILGLSNYPTFSSDAIRVPQSSGNKNTPQLGDRTPEDFAHDYKLPSGSGKGSTIGIVTLAATDTQSAYDFWNQVLQINSKPNRITVDNVDGGPGELSDSGGSGESTLDVEQSGALAPQANIIVYQSPNTDPGFLDGFFQAASDNQADGVSASWGEAETVINYFVKNGLEAPAYQDAFDEAFLELGAQGQSSFVSSGDAGAYDDSDELGTTNLDIDSPGNSPWVLSSGGTTQAGIIPLATDDQGNITDSAQIKQERAWSYSWLWPHYQDFCFLFADPSDCTEANFAIEVAAAGDGGGYSGTESMPSWQRQIGAQHFNAVEFLTPTNPDSTDFAPLTEPTGWNFNPNPSVQSGSSNGRAEPDLSADADPFTGYELLWSFGSEPGSKQPESVETGWGGTSFVDPQFNGSNAVMVANLGHRIGLWTPQIYSFAQSHNSPFATLDSASTDNNNLFYTGSPHQLWNPATGLGIPDLSALQSDFAHGSH